MAIGMKPLICPQCGSVETKPSLGNSWTCRCCGTSFIAQPHVETQNVYNETNYHFSGEDSSDEPLSNIVGRFHTKYDKTEFIRQAWIDLARQDAPFEVFQTDFSEVGLVEHQVVVDYAAVTVNYQASIGYDRTETYVEKERYYEDGKERYRDVTKTRTVIDWHPTQGNLDLASTVVVENSSGIYFDADLFRLSYNSKEEDDITLFTGEEEEKYQVSNYAREEAGKKHDQYYERMIASSLPGDHQKDITYSTMVKKTDTALCLTPEYTATVTLDGKTYTRRAFPFGKMTTGGDDIPNPESLALQQEEKHRRIPHMVWNENKTIYIVSIALILLSVILSLAVRLTILKVMGFIAAVAGFIVAWVMESKARKEIEAVIEEECAVLAKEYKDKQLALLNGKLSSLGLDPADSSYIEEESRK